MPDKNDVHIFQLVYLWNSFDKIKGVLHLTPSNLDFIADGFEHTHLELSIPLSKIVKLEFYKLFDITVLGLKIDTIDKKTTIFILENSKILKNQIEQFKSGSP